MHLGELVETAPRDELVRRPLHPYTQALLSAVPKIVPGERGERIRLAGDLPSPLAPPAGCRFHTRCPHSMPACRTIPPVLTDLGGGRSVACHLHVALDSPSSARPA